MTDQPATTRSSLLYAMGSLAEQSKQQAEEIGRLRTTQEDLPDKVAAAVLPRIVALEHQVQSMDKRIWLVTGAGGVIIMIVQHYILPALVNISTGR